MRTFTCRAFLTESVAGTGGLLLAFHLPASGKARPFEPWESANAEINAWLGIGADDSITIRVAQSELGQGVFTSMPMIIAEELEADWRTVRAEYASVNRHIREGSPYQRMATRDSGAVTDSREILQTAGAEARERLIKAASERWSVPPEQCYADYGRIHRRGSDESFSFGEVAADAAGVRVAGVRIKSPEDFNLLGLPTPRLDVPAKVDGSAIYSIDVRLPDMVYATVVHCPVLGGKVRSLRFNAIRNLPGVLKTVRATSWVAVVAEHFWQAKTAADQLPIQWTMGALAKTSTYGFRDDFVAALETPGQVLESRGDIVQAMDDAETSIESDYISPYLSCAPMEPMNCTVKLGGGRLDVWIGTQDPEGALETASAQSGVARENVYIHNCFSGGSFGRRRSMDFLREAITIAKEVGKPVQMIWSREEDQRSGHYRPMSATRMKAGFDLDKKLVAYTNQSVTHSIARDQDPDFQGIDESSVEGLTDLPLRVKHKRVTHSAINTHLTSGYWRSRGHSQNAYAKECFVDEMAVAAGQDAMAYRRNLYRDSPAFINVLEELAGAVRWGRAMPQGSAQGLAIHECFGTICGQVAEVTVSQQGGLKIDRIVSVLDCGNLVNPTTAEMQIESAVIFGLSAALYGKLTVEDGVVLEDNFDTYRMVTMADTPVLETHFILSGSDKWGGLGGPATPTVAPALCNALYRITGRRIRALPVGDYMLVRR